MKTRDEMKAEAVRRMRALRIFPESIKQFENSDYVSLSEPPFGANYWLSDTEKDMASKVEEMSGGLVYFVVRTWTKIGEMISFLYVEKEEDEWCYFGEGSDNEVAYVMTYTYNLDAPDCSEFGEILVEPKNGGLQRIG